MDLQERYDELDTIETEISMLIDRISDKDYIEQLQEIMYQAQNDKEEIEPRVQEMWDNEYNELQRQYERSVL